MSSPTTVHSCRCKGIAANLLDSRYDLDRYAAAWARTVKFDHQDSLSSAEHEIAVADLDRFRWSEDCGLDMGLGVVIDTVV